MVPDDYSDLNRPMALAVVVLVGLAALWRLFAGPIGKAFRLALTFIRMQKAVQENECELAKLRREWEEARDEAKKSRGRLYEKQEEMDGRMIRLETNVTALQTQLDLGFDRMFGLLNPAAKKEPEAEPRPNAKEE